MTNELANNMVIIHNQNADKIVSFLGTLKTATPVKLECSELLTAYTVIKKSNCFIPSAYFDNLINLIIPLLTKIFNFYLDANIFPAALKSANIFPLYKGKGEKTDHLSYRPISIIPLLGKLLEKVTQSKLVCALEPNLTDFQHGFRKFRSCISAWSVLKNKITKALDVKKNLVGAVFIDMKKAFDYVHSP